MIFDCLPVSQEVRSNPHRSDSGYVLKLRTNQIAWEREVHIHQNILKDRSLLVPLIEAMAYGISSDSVSEDILVRECKRGFKAVKGAQEFLCNFPFGLCMEKATTILRHSYNTGWGMVHLHCKGKLLLLLLIWPGLFLLSLVSISIHSPRSRLGQAALTTLALHELLALQQALCAQVLDELFQ